MTQGIASPVLKRGARVRFVGIVHPCVSFGAEGVVTGQRDRRWVADFPVGERVERVTLHRSELEVLADDLPSQACECGRTGAEHPLPDCPMFEPAQPAVEVL